MQQIGKSFKNLHKKFDKTVPEPTPDFFYPVYQNVKGDTCQGFDEGFGYEHHINCLENRLFQHYSIQQ